MIIIFIVFFITSTEKEAMRLRQYIESFAFSHCKSDMRALSSWFQMSVMRASLKIRVHSVLQCLLKREERAAMKHHVPSDLDL